MKKIALVLILATGITAGTAFAEYPDGWGVGIVGGFHAYWDSDLDNVSNWALSLKVPSLPIFWAIDLEIRNSYFALGVRGDYYLFHQALVEEINLDWYFGIGGWASLGIPDKGDTSFAFGARLPIGLSWQPIDLIEVFLEIAPTLGIRVTPDFHFPAGGWGGAIGIRFWF